MVLHVWDQRQKTNDGKEWFGPYKLRLQQGETKLLVTSDGDRIKLFINSFKNSKVIEECIKKASELLNLNTESFLKKVDKGQYKITPQGVKNIRVIDGFKLVRIDLAALDISPGEITFEGSMTVLYDFNHKKIMSTTTGLIACENNSRMNLPNFMIEESVFFHDIYKMNLFSPSFSIDYMAKSECAKLIEDLNVKKPRLTKETIKRLNLKDYESRDPDEYDQFLLETVGFSETNEQRIKRLMDIKKAKSMEPEDPGIISFLLDEENPDESKVIMDIISKSSMDFNDQILGMDFDIDISLITSHSELITSKPVALFNLALHIKELLIAKCVTDLSMISRKTLDAVLKVTGSVGVYYSCLFIYDKIYQHSEMRSPTGIKIEIEPLFYEKFIAQVDS
jgi:hypothetical protein